MDWNIDQIAKGIKSGDRLSLSRALTLVESTRKSDIIIARDLINTVLPWSGNSIRIGITGAPGVGKSTFIEKLGQTLLQNTGNLAVLSVDPTSPSSGGSILGDKTRMEELSRDERVFVRPTPSGSESGGVSANIRDQITLCEAAGFGVIVVETVGVGQAETAVSLMVDYLLLLLMPGSGDDLQGIKRGIMELAHAFAFNKVDVTDQGILTRSVSDLKQALHLFHEEMPDIFQVSALTGSGVDQVWTSIEEFSKKKQTSGEWQKKREAQDITYFDALLKRQVISEVLQNEKTEAKMLDIKKKIAAGELSPVSAVNHILQFIFNREIKP